MAVFFIPGILPAQKTGFALPEPTLTETVFISADRVDYDRDRNILHLQGQVEIRQDPWRLLAEEVEVNLTTRQAFATGGVRITQGEGEAGRTMLQADQAEMDLSGAGGWMIQARLSVPWEKGEIRLNGRRMERVNESTYRIEQGSMTPCQCPPDGVPDWEVQARRLTAETEKQVTVSSARVKIRGRTVFYLPYLSYPIGTQRRTGFLLPVLDLSSLDGFEATLPFFWPFHPSADLTLLPHYIAERGFETGSEFRYNLGPAAQGEARAYYIPDYQEPADRGSVQLQHSSTWGRDYALKAELNLVSDNEYLTDFHHDLGHRYDRYLESRLIADRLWPGAHLYAKFSWFDDLQGGELRPSAFGPDLDSSVIQRLPELRYQLLTFKLLGPLHADLSVRAEDYWREDVSLGRGQMLDVFPRLALPYRLGSVAEGFAAAGYHGIFYHPDPVFDPESSARGQAEAAAQISSEFFRVYPGRPEGHRYRHTLEPKLFAFYQEAAQDPLDQFFPIADPRPELGWVGLNLENRLFRKSNSSGPGSPAKEIGRLELTQAYDFLKADFPDLRLESSGAPGKGFRVQLESYFGWEVGEFTRIESRLAYRDPEKNEFSLGYRWDSGQVKSQYFQFDTQPGRDLTGGLELGLGPRLRARYRGHYSLEYDRFVSQLLGFEYASKQKCWGLNLALTDRLRPDQPREPHDYSAQLTFQLEK